VSLTLPTSGQQCHVHRWPNSYFEYRREFESIFFFFKNSLTPWSGRSLGESCLMKKIVVENLSCLRIFVIYIFSSFAKCHCRFKWTKVFTFVHLSKRVALLRRNL
jgi:hypothetical protein